MAQTESAAVMPTTSNEEMCNNPNHVNLSNGPKLEDQAANAALYVPNPSRQSDVNNRQGYKIIGADHKLSSAGAAASLKYARPQDLPSYPVSGLKNGDSAAGAAASIGWSNQKAFEHWKPDPSSSASAAAMLAKDYKMAPLWQPETSANGAKAALLAARNGGKVEIWQPEPTAWGNSAATQAMKMGNTLSPVLDYGHTDIGRKGSLMAATGAMSSSRKRAESQPVVIQKQETYPDEANAMMNAMSAANAANSASRANSRRINVSSEAGAVPYTTMGREMYTSHPPVAPEVEEQNRQETLHASAVAMAKQIYSTQQKQIDAATKAQASSGAQAAHHRRRSVDSDEITPMRFNSLQEAAQKLAQERLAKLHDEHDQNREYRDYYNGESQASVSSPRSRMQLRGRARRRASSEGSYNDDQQQSNAIRAQMSLFSDNLSQVDEKKRQKDREALLAVAQRNVTKSLHGMDEKVFADTGKVAPSLLSEWEVKAYAAAQAKSNSRMENYGKVNIGGGKFVDQSEVNQAAQRNVQPVLDEINEKAAIERERQAVLKADQELERKKAAEKKTRDKEEKEINKKLRTQDKEERKAREAEEKRLSKEKRKSASAISAAVAPIVHEPEAETEAETEEATHVVSSETPVEEPVTERREVVPEPHVEEPVAEHAVVSEPVVRTSMEEQAGLRMQQNADAANTDLSTPMSPTTGGESGGLRSWIKTKLRRSSKPAAKPTNTSSTGKEIEKESESGFVGGAALTGANNTSTNTNENSTTTNSAHEVTNTHVEPLEDTTRGRPIAKNEVGVASGSGGIVSPVLSAKTDEGTEEFQEARDNFDEDLAPPPGFETKKEPSPARLAKFTEGI